LLVPPFLSQLFSAPVSSGLQPCFVCSSHRPVSTFSNPKGLFSYQSKW
jgi:hypothetical protein